MIPTWMIYTYAYIISACMFWGPYFIRGKINAKEALHMYIAAGVVVLAISFNIMYTALMGWNRLPGSGLEFTLDMISGALQIGGMIYYYYTLHGMWDRIKGKKKDEVWVKLKEK